MHFNLDLKKRRCWWRKTLVSQTAFFLKNESALCPALSVVPGNGTLLSTAFKDRRGYGWKSASERPIRSAFNGPEGKVRRITPFFPLLSKCFGTFLLEYPKKQILFCFIYCGCLLYMNCVCGTRSFSAPLDLWICSSQTQMEDPTIAGKGGISGEAEGWVLEEETGSRKAFFFLVFHLACVLCCSPKTADLLPSGHYRECLWSSRGAFPLPCLPKNALLHLQ